MRVAHTTFLINFGSAINFCRSIALRLWAVLRSARLINDHKRLFFYLYEVIVWFQLQHRWSAAGRVVGEPTVPLSSDNGMEPVACFADSGALKDKRYLSVLKSVFARGRRCSPAKARPVTSSRCHCKCSPSSPRAPFHHSHHYQQKLCSPPETSLTVLDMSS